MTELRGISNLRETDWGYYVDNNNNEVIEIWYSEFNKCWYVYTYKLESEKALY